MCKLHSPQDASSSEVESADPHQPIERILEVDDEVFMRRPATFKEWKELTGEDLEPEPTEAQSALQELLLPPVYEFSWPEQMQKDASGNVWCIMENPRFRGGINPNLIPRSDLSPEEYSRRGSRLAELANLAFPPTLPAERSEPQRKDPRGRKNEPEIDQALTLHAAAVRSGCVKTQWWGSVRQSISSYLRESRAAWTQETEEYREKHREQEPPPFPAEFQRVKKAVNMRIFREMCTIASELYATWRRKGQTEDGAGRRVWADACWQNPLYEPRVNAPKSKERIINIAKARYERTRQRRLVQ